MNNAKTLLKNTLLLAIGSIILKGVALCFQIYLAKKAGAVNLGIYGLMSSVYCVFTTIAISGLRFSVTRITAEEAAAGKLCPKNLMGLCLKLCLIFGLVAFLAMFLCADYAASNWVNNSSAGYGLRILAYTLPFISLSAVLEGYYSALQKVARLIILQFFDQIIRIFTVVLLLKTEMNIFSVLSFGCFSGEIFYCISVCLIFLISTRNTKNESKVNNGTKRLLKISMPIAISAYARTGLSSLGHIIIPFGLKSAGMGKEGALMTYGIINQMALPVLFFPLALTSALGQVLVPRLTQSQTQNKTNSIRYIVSRSMRSGLYYSFLMCGIMFFYSDLFGNLLYKSTEAGLYMKILAPIIPIIYIDCVTDGCLKGLGQHLHSMILNITEAAINVILLLILLPKFAIIGYILTIYIKEIFNTYFSYRRLRKITQINIDVYVYIAVIMAVIGAKIFVDILIKTISIICLPLYIIFYLLIIYLINQTLRDDIKWIFGMFRT